MAVGEWRCATCRDMVAYGVNHFCGPVPPVDPEDQLDALRKENEVLRIEWDLHHGPGKCLGVPKSMVGDACPGCVALTVRETLTPETIEAAIAKSVEGAKDLEPGLNAVFGGEPVRWLTHSCGTDYVSGLMCPKCFGPRDR